MIRRARAILAEGRGPSRICATRLKRAKPGANELVLGFAGADELLLLVQVPVGDGGGLGFPANLQFALAEEWLGSAWSPTGTPAPP